MCQSDIELDKYWVTHSGHFRLATTLVLGIFITDDKLLYCRIVEEGNMDRKFSTLEFKNSTVYYCFNNPFTDKFCTPALNLPPIIPCSHKRARYTPDLIPAAISIASEKYFSTLTTPSYSLDILSSNNTNILHVMKKYVIFPGRIKSGCCCWKHDKNICYRNTKVLLLHML